MKLYISTSRVKRINISLVNIFCLGEKSMQCFSINNAKLGKNVIIDVNCILNLFYAL